MAHTDKAQVLWDIHQIQQVYLTYAAAMDSHQWDLMEQCFTEDAEVCLSALAIKLSGGVERLDFRGWQQMCRTIDPTFDMLQHYIYPPLVKVDEDVAHARVYFVAQHVKNELAPDSIFTMGGWYNGELVRYGEGWRISRHELVDTWLSGNPEVIGCKGLPTGAAERVAGHAIPAWLTV